MAKYWWEPIRQGDIDKCVADQTDLAFEMTVVRLLHELGVPLEHGGTYDDPVTGKPRQFDIRAQIYKRYGAVGRLIQLPIEVKNLKRNNPLVVHELRRKEPEVFHQIVGAWLHDLPKAMEPNAVSELVSPSAAYPEGAFCGKKTDQIHRTIKNDKPDELEVDDREIYDKWSQAISSAHDLVGRACMGPERLNVPWCFAIVLPIVVIPDSTLWVVQYSDDGQRRNAQLAQRSSFYVNREIDFTAAMWGLIYRISHIEFMTFSYLSGFLGRLNNEMASELDQWIPPSRIASIQQQRGK